MEDRAADNPLVPVIADLADDEIRRRVMRLDGDRRVALRELSTLLVTLVEQTQAVAEVAMRSDLDAINQLRGALADVRTDPALELVRITETYNRLRLALVEHHAIQHRSIEPAPMPVAPTPPRPNRMRPDQSLTSDP